MCSSFSICLCPPSGDNLLMCCVLVADTVYNNTYPLNIRHDGMTFYEIILLKRIYLYSPFPVSVQQTYLPFANDHVALRERPRCSSRTLTLPFANGK